jgi:hypothetical protein
VDLRHATRCGTRPSSRRPSAATAETQPADRGPGQACTGPGSISTQHNVNVGLANYCWR